MAHSHTVVTPLNVTAALTWLPDCHAARPCKPQPLAKPCQRSQCCLCRVASTNLVLDYTLGAAAVARSFTSYAGALLAGNADLLRIATASPLVKIDVPALVVTLALCAVLGRGMHGSSAFNMAITALSIVVILFVFVAGLTQFDGGNLRPFAPQGARGVLSGASQA